MKFVSLVVHFCHVYFVCQQCSSCLNENFKAVFISSRITSLVQRLNFFLYLLKNVLRKRDFRVGLAWYFLLKRPFSNLCRKTNWFWRAQTKHERSSLLLSLLVLKALKFRNGKQCLKKVNTDVILGRGHTAMDFSKFFQNLQNFPGQFFAFFFFFFEWRRLARGFKIYCLISEIVQKWALQTLLRICSVNHFCHSIMWLAD